MTLIRLFLLIIFLSIFNQAIMAKTITTEFRDESIEIILQSLVDEYVYPKIAKKMQSSVLSKLANNEYAEIIDSNALAEKLTADLRAVSHDKHLSVSVRGSNRSKPMLKKRRVNPRKNYGFEKAKMLDNNIGYFKFNMFSESSQAFSIAAKMLKKIASAKTIIFDLRDNIGGSPRMIEFISSYIFHKPTKLNLFFDRDGNEVGQSLTHNNIPGQPFSKKVKIYILTSNFTFSAAEEFTYNLQSFERATVVGETTGGGAHPITSRTIKNTFRLTIPFMRAYNPITQSNWEGVGVIPDIKSSADNALEVAMLDAKL